MSSDEAAVSLGEVDRGLSPGRPRQRLQILALVVCLWAPSLWLFATVPPLWRDVDGYKQVTQHPAKSAHSGHGVLYCLAARVPLAVGQGVERLTGGTAGAPTESGLTDTGIALLIGAQHVGLGLAALLVVWQAAQGFVIRLALAAAFAVNPLFYAFAHSVGSESLSVILLLVLAALGLRTMRASGGPALKAGLLFALTLYAAVLTRHANMLLAFLLPVALLFPYGQRRGARIWAYAAVALLLSLVSIGLARATTSAVCRTKKLDYYSRVGFTFLWRLPFVNSLTEGQREALFARVIPRAESDDARRVLVLLREMAGRGTPLGPDTVLEPTRELLTTPGTTKGRAKRVDIALNGMAEAFLSPPAPELWAAAKSDFLAAGATLLSRTTEFLIGTTAYFFNHQSAMPEAAGLRTFRDYTRTDLIVLPQTNAYLRWWSFLSLKHTLAAWGVAVVGLLLLGWRKHARGPLLTAAYGTVLVALAVLMVASTCLIGELLPRYTLPVWEAVWIALMFALGTAAESLCRKTDRRTGSDGASAGEDATRS